MYSLWRTHSDRISVEIYLHFWMNTIIASLRVISTALPSRSVFAGKILTAFNFLQEHKYDNKYDITLMIPSSEEIQRKHTGYINIQHSIFPVWAEPQFPIRFKDLPLWWHFWALFDPAINSSPYQHHCFKESPTTYWIYLDLETTYSSLINST